MPFGTTFAPTSQAAAELAAEPRPAATPSRAIQLLSLRLPRRAEGSAIAPQELLEGTGGAGLPPGLLERLLRALLEMSQAGPSGGGNFEDVISQLSGQAPATPAPVAPMPQAPAPVAPTPRIGFSPPPPTGPSSDFLRKLREGGSLTSPFGGMGGGFGG